MTTKNEPISLYPEQKKQREEPPPNNGSNGKKVQVELQVEQSEAKEDLPPIANLSSVERIMVCGSEIGEYVATLLSRGYTHDEVAFCMSGATSRLLTKANSARESKRVDTGNNESGSAADKR